MVWKSLQQSPTNYNEVDYAEDQFNKDSSEDQFNKVTRQGENEYWDQINKITRAEEEEEFEFVEPMVFDLVRGLGAKPGESEVNYLMIIPLNGDPATFSPGTHSTSLFYESIDLQLCFIMSKSNCATDWGSEY